MLVTIVKSDKRSREKPCLRCGYSLRKLIDSKYCPECGLSIWLSLNQNDALERSNPAWLRRLAVACIALAAAQVMGMVMLVASHPALWAEGLELGAQTLSAMILLAQGVYFLDYATGLILLVRSERRYPDRLKAHRYWAWGVAAFGMLSAGAMLVAAFTDPPLWVFAYPLHLMLLADAVVTLAYLRCLARRAGNHALGRICGYVMLLPIVSFAKSFPLFAFLLAFEAVGALDYLPWVYLPVSMALLIWFAVIFHRASRSARQSWDVETDPAVRLRAAPTGRKHEFTPRKMQTR